jgi:CheY-like chemotaxis protein
MQKNPDFPYFKIILMDYDMPIMKGDEATRAIKLFIKD